MSDEKKFWAKIKKIPGGCWEWQGQTNEHGYGRETTKGKNKQAHRIAYELENGPIPNGMLVCHSCDNRKCVRVSHLWLGTCKDNSEDMVNKGRSGKGARNSRAKLTEAQVRRIFREKGKQTSPQVGSQYGVSPCAVLKIWKGVRWQHLKLLGNVSGVSGRS